MYSLRQMRCRSYKVIQSTLFSWCPSTSLAKVDRHQDASSSPDQSVSEDSILLLLYAYYKCTSRAAHAPEIENMTSRIGGDEWRFEPVWRNSTDNRLNIPHSYIIKNLFSLSGSHKLRCIVSSWPRANITWWPMDDTINVTQARGRERNLTTSTLLLSTPIRQDRTVHENKP